MTFYLKYRPQTLNELVGQEGVKKILSSSFLANKLSHGYLLTGPRGTGKTSTARILAKMVNCVEKNPPCNKCSTCLSITDGSNLDLIEIDAASNRGIDDIRTLREKIKLSPTASKKKVYIIDEVHMLTQEAFNALLKTLEEPPQHAFFILATTDASKLPQTILSRVQRLDFKLASIDELLTSFKKIVTMEKIDIDIDGLKLLAKKAEGSFRDGIKLLDQISSMGGKITSKKLEEILKNGEVDEIFKLLESFSKKDAKSSLEILGKIFENGIEPKTFNLNLMDVLRNMIFIKNGLGESLVEPQYSQEDFITLKNLSEDFSKSELIRILDLLQKSLEKLKFASIPTLPLELVAIEVCGFENSIKTIDDKQSLRSDDLGESKIEKQEIVNPPSSIIENPSSTIDHPSSNDSPDILRLKEKWTFVLETIRPYNFSLEALLRSIQIAECSADTVIISVPYSFHQRIIEAPKNREILESVLSDVLGRQIKVATILGVRPQRSEDIANIEVAQDDEIIRAAAEIFSSDTVN